MGAIDIEMVGGEGIAGMGHHHTAAIGQGLDGDPPQSPTLLGSRIAMEQAKGQGKPRLRPGRRQDEQGIAPGLAANASDGGEDVVEL